MFKIPLQYLNLTVFSDHGWRFGMLKAFYITIDDSNAIYEAYNIATFSSDDDSSDDDSSGDDVSDAKKKQNVLAILFNRCVIILRNIILQYHFNMHSDGDFI